MILGLGVRVEGIAFSGLGPLGLWFNVERV